MEAEKNLGLRDILSSVRGIYLPLYLAQADIKQRYRRSVLGPFWITISTGVMVACLGGIFGNLFKTPLFEILPFIASGLIIWGLISGCLTDATTVFCSSEAIIKQLPIPLFTHILRMVARNFYIFLHNLIIIPIVLLFVQRPVGFNFLYFFPGILVLILNLLWFSLVLAIVCARYRDLTQIVINVLQIFFYLTPIIWMPNALEGRSRSFVLDSNPLYHLMEIVRAPIMNSAPTLLNWIVSISILVVGWIASILIFNRYKRKIAYWL